MLPIPFTDIISFLLNLSRAVFEVIPVPGASAVIDALRALVDKFKEYKSEQRAANALDQKLHRLVEKANDIIREAQRRGVSRLIHAVLRRHSTAGTSLPFRPRQRKYANLYTNS
ncbi:hypothetical protein FKP32DRAFT_1687702 [Trametes sanguinea]|nr:hypothetical protein FKP32DRAFT_1687702 [Trametes sanguinea]